MPLVQQPAPVANVTCWNILSRLIGFEAVTLVPQPPPVTTVACQKSCLVTLRSGSGSSAAACSCHQCDLFQYLVPNNNKVLCFQAVAAVL